jgi:hypothetical protein
LWSELFEEQYLMQQFMRQLHEGNACSVYVDPVIYGSVGSGKSLDGCYKLQLS